MSNQAYYVGYSDLGALFEDVEPPVTVYLMVTIDRRQMVMLDVQWIDVSARTVNYWRHQIGRCKETNGSAMQLETNLVVLNCAESLRKVVHHWLRERFRGKGDWKLKNGVVAIPRDLELVPAGPPSFLRFIPSTQLYVWDTTDLCTQMGAAIAGVNVVPLIPPANEERQMGQFRA